MDLQAIQYEVQTLPLQELQNYRAQVALLARAPRPNEKAVAILKAIDSRLQPLEKKMTGSDTPWSKIDKSKLPNSAFADPKNRRLPHHNPGGAVNRHGVIAALAAISGARTGKKMTGLPASARAHLLAHAKALGIGRFAKAMSEMGSEVLDSFDGTLQIGQNSIAGTYCLCRREDKMKFVFVPDDPISFENESVCGSVDEISVPYPGTYEGGVSGIMDAMRWSGMGMSRMAKGAAEVSFKVPIVKADDSEHLVYGVVMTPDVPMAVGQDGPYADVATKEEVRKACHAFMADSRTIDYGHKRNLSSQQAVPVEDFIAPVAFDWPKPDGSTYHVPQGAWVQVTKIFDEAIWNDITSGKLNDYSITGWADAEEVND